jgi:hypothetical protein
VGGGVSGLGFFFFGGGELFVPGAPLEPFLIHFHIPGNDCNN